MGLFSLFKKKAPTHEEKLALAFRCYKQEMVGHVFPGGQEQANKVLKSLSMICGINLDECTAKQYYDVLTIFSHVFVRREVTNVSDDSIILSLEMKHNNHIKDEKTAKKVLAFCKINMRHPQFALDSMENLMLLEKEMDISNDVVSQKKPIDSCNKTFIAHNKAADIIPHLSKTMHLLLQMNYLAYKNNGHVNVADVNKGLNYHEMKEFEELLVALSNTSCVSGEKDYLRLVEEVICPPSEVSEGSSVFCFADKLKQGTCNENDVKDFEAFAKEKLECGEKDFSIIEAEVTLEEYRCPLGDITSKELSDFDKALKNRLVHASHNIGISCWFRQYTELTIPSLNYAKKLHNGGAGLAAMTRLPEFKGNTVQAFAVMCARAMHAGLVAAHLYCESKGDVSLAETKLDALSATQIADKAAQLLNFQAGNDREFVRKYAPVPLAAADFLVAATANQNMFFKGMLLALTAMFQYGTGLYFE